MNIFINGIIVFVLLISGIGKIIDPMPAIQLMQKLPLIPDFLVLPIASIMPVMELAIAAGIIFRYKKELTYLLNLLLFSGFFVISIYGTLLKISDDCGCFGSLMESKVGWTMVIRNTLFLGMATYLFVKNNQEFVIKIMKRAGVN